MIFADTHAERRYLLLKRIDSQGGFWQSVTGSLKKDETHKRAAVREVFEETGLLSTEAELIDLGVINIFEIAPQWRERYAPGVTHNEELCFALRVREYDVRLDVFEHQASAWEPFGKATRMVYWESTRRALAAARLLAD